MEVAVIENNAALYTGCGLAYLEIVVEDKSQLRIVL